jgi:RNA polymerase sigma factor (sigma-70 family)
MEARTEDTLDWALATAGDGEAFGRIYDRHRDRVYRHCLRLVDVPEDAKDVVAAAFLEAWRRRFSVRFVDGSLLPWLLTTATNCSRNANRSQRRYRALLDRIPEAEVARDPSEVVGGEANSALLRLPSHQRDVAVLCLLEGYSEADAAKVLGVAPGTIKSRLSRARARLSKELGDLRAVNSF